ncbi:MAG: carbohydrate kinase [Deltaproteobacteria bacterium]|nr:carbohydrate kinase [Deltaproteobacteria bacterium]
MRIAFVGHVSIDHNVTNGKEHVLNGGGVLHGAVTARRLGADAVVFTRCAPADRERFSVLADAGVPAFYLPGERTTSARNVYPTANPDDRVTYFVSRAEPFRASDLDAIDADVIHVNPLWFGEFPDDLLPAARARAGVLAGDAQGFLRHVGDGEGRCSAHDWATKSRYLPLFDVFKADIGEATTLTGCDDPVAAAAAVRALGPRTVLLTHHAGVCVHDGDCHEASFGPYSIEGRTGRGDTFTAAFLVASARMPIDEATRFAADVTSRKMQYAGPFRG